MKNDVAHVLPYMSFLWMPRDRFFAECTVQADIPASGNRVTVDYSGSLGSPVSLTFTNPTALNAS